jgi:hypothetical protein
MLRVSVAYWNIEIGLIFFIRAEKSTLWLSEFSEHLGFVHRRRSVGPLVQSGLWFFHQWGRLRQAGELFGAAGSIGHTARREVAMVSIGLPQLVFLAVAVLIIWAIMRPRGPSSF